MKFNMHKNLISEKFKSMFFVATLSMLIEYVVLLSDNIIAGNLLGEKALSAITLISPFFSIMFFLSFIFSIGTGILTAYEIGKGNREKVNQYFSQGIILAVIFGVCLNITFLLLKKQLLSLFEVSFNIYKYAYDYFSVLIWIPLPIILSSVLYEVVISEGGEKRCFYSSIVQVGSNIIISIVLCKLIGIKGIALGTVISNILAALVIASYFLYEHNELRFKWYINLKSIVDMVKYSINDALNYFYLAVTQFLMNVFLVSNFGERVIIVYTVVNNMLSLLMAVTDGIGGTIQSIISVYRGENNFLGIKKTMYIASFVAAIEGIIINAAIIIMADFIPKIFGINESDILHEAVKAARIFSFFSIFNSILMLMSSYYEAPSSGTIGDNLTWVLDSEGTLTISGTGDIPESSAHTLAPWYAQRQNIKTVIIDDGITSLPAKAFISYENLTTVIMEDDVTSIGDSAFASCKKLTDVTLSANLTVIEDKAFLLCSELSNIVLPNSITSIGKYAFQQCLKLPSVTLGNNMTSIGAGAFEQCTQLQQVVIPDNVVSLGGFAFAHCTSLTSVTVGAGLSQISANAFSYCSSLTSINIPDNISNIGENAFTNCAALTNVTMHKGITSIDGYAFYQCTKLSQVNFPEGLKQIGRYAFGGCSELQKLDFGQGLETIGEQAFSHCKSLVHVNFPDSLTSIGYKAFDYCPNYLMIVLPANIETIGFAAFYTGWHVWFKGTQSQWNSIPFDITDSTALNRKTVHFNCSGNELKTEVVAPTCTAAGYTQYTCTCCQEYRQSYPKVATGHSYGAWYVAKEATFTSKGIERRDCSKCGKYESKDIPMKTHTDKNNDSICDDCGSKFCTKQTEELLPGKNETCTQDGLTEGKKCSFCDAILQAQEVIPASGHHYGDWTTTTEGAKERICELCGEKEQQPEAPTPTTTPSWETIGTLPTTQSGATSSDKAAKTNPVIVVLIVLAAGGVAGGAAAVLIKKKKK